jgi:hypothetical protein
MKRIFIGLLFIAMASFTYAGVIEKTYTFSSPKITDAGAYHLVSFDNLYLTGITGEPVLPYREVILLLPPGEEAVSIEVIGSNEVPLSGYYTLFPRQASRPLSDSSPGEFAMNESVYNTDDTYPAKPFGTLTTQYMNGYAIALASFTPVQYHPLSGALYYYQTVKIRVHTKPAGKSTSALDNLVASKRITQRINTYVQNPEMAKRYPCPAKETDDYHLLIITPQQFEDDFSDYLSIYPERGILTNLVTVETIESTSTGQDLQEKIRNFIIGEYQDHSIELVLLGGDVEHVPYRGFYCYVESGSGYTDNSIPADLYYSALDGTWNDDGDNLWGEIGEDDLLPEVGVARMSFSNTPELSNMINKTNLYQNDPVLGEFNETTLAGEWLYSNPETWGSDYLELLIGYQDENGYETWGIPEEYNFHKLYEEVSSWGANDLIDEINSGRQYIHHVGHASSSYVAYMSNSTITNNNFSGANGVDHNYTIFHSHGCICGAFDDSDCIMEKMVSIDNFAVAVVGNSRYGWFNEGQTEGPAQHLHREMVDALYHERINHIGAAFVECKIQTAPWVTAPGQWEEGALRWNFYDINILGDPALSVWTQEPISVEVDHSGVFVLGDNSYDVTITSNGEPQENFRCVVLFEDEICGVGLTDDQGQTSITIDGIENPGDAQLVVSGYNCLPTWSDITVILPGPTFVHYSGHVVDDAQGNGNGQIDFGEENLLFDITLENLGTETAENVEATLAIQSSYITVTQNTAVFGSIGPNASITLPGAFTFSVADDVPDQEILDFEITINWGDGEEQVINYFSEYANAPVLEIGNLSIDDVQNGNGNGILDPGETVTVSIDVLNNGHCACENTTAELSTTSAGVNITNPSCPLNTLMAGGSASAEYTVEINENVPIIALVEFLLDVESGAYSASQGYSLSVGMIVEDFETGNFSSYGWSFGGASDWQISDENPYEGIYSAKSGTIGDQQESELEISMDVLYDGEISFYRKVSSEDNYDYLRFYMDGILLDEWAGEEAWDQVTYPVEGGPRTFMWSYEKDYSVSNGSDCAWVDFIVFPASTGIGNVLSVAANANPGQICPGESSQLTLDISGGSGNFTYTWTPAQGLNDPTIINPLASPQETTTYSVEVDDGDQSATAEVTVTVHPIPQIPVIIQEDDHLISDATEGNQWYGTSGPISGATAQVFYPSATDAYFVVVENTFGCTSDPSNTINFVFTGTAERQVRSLKVIPNPSTGRFSIIPDQSASDATIVVRNLMNDEIMKLKRNLDTGKAVTLDLSNQPAGIYVITIRTGKNQQTIKAIVQ